MTHRVFSRNAASSRAIPHKKMLERLEQDPAVPVEWGRNQPGMQASQQVDDVAAAESWWLRGYELLKPWLAEGEALGLHKQILNRPVEPWFNIEVICTATEWDNFYSLRTHASAQPEIRVLAEHMLAAQRSSTPVVVKSDGWHLPFVGDDEIAAAGLDAAKKFSVARCARVSYLNHDGSAPDEEKDLKLFHQLLEAGHVSPFEHQACALTDGAVISGNFVGWRQFRKDLPGENRTNFSGLRE